jgi:hypothetical protein
MIKFEWDTTKAATNEKKHGISFGEAKSVFYDEFAVQFYDNVHSKKAWGQVFKFESKNAYIWPNSAVKRDVPPYGGFESLFFFMVRWLRSSSVSGAPLITTLDFAKEPSNASPEPISSQRSLDRFQVE